MSNYGNFDSGDWEDLKKKARGAVGAARNAARLGIVFAEAAIDKATDGDPHKPSVSQMALIKMSMKEKFNAAAAYPDIFARHQFIFFGDTNHSDIRIHEYFYSEKNIRAMAKAGVKHVFPEMEPQYQGLVDDVAAGRLTPAQFVREVYRKNSKNPNLSLSDALKTPVARQSAARMQETAKGFQLMHKMGMKIHCLDDRKNLDPAALQNIFTSRQKMQNYSFEKHNGPGIIHGKMMMRYVIDNWRTLSPGDFGSASASEAMKKRMLDDVDLARRMKAVAGTEKSAILFGAGHAHNPGSLFDCLGRDKTVRIDIYSSLDMCGERMIGITGMMKGQIDPDYIHIIDTSTLYKFRSGPGAAP